ncbi:MAG TPA: DUF58 domain-containing protein [Bryobacteraceae bacterium]|nr:DUF58 domain-containing protein [Bryobacteraceae bacterium]
MMTVRGIAARLSSALSFGLRQQVTRAGVAFALTLLVIALAAFLSANNLLFLILAAMLSTLLVSGFISRLGLAGLELDLVLPEHISARRKVRAGIRLKNLKRWIPSFSIHLAGAPESGVDAILYFPVVPGGAVLEESLEVYFARRGAQRDRSFQFSTRFPFGFSERREMVTASHDVIVYPCLDPQPGFEALLASVRGEIEAQQRGRGHDFYRIRPYEAFESARHVDWKATAHTGDLQVREFAREQDHRILIYFDLDIPFESEAWFESAVDCAAFLAFHLAAQGAAVRLASQDFDLSLPDEGDIYTILKYLALVSPKRGRLPVGPDDPDSFHIVFSANPERMSALGWGKGENRGARLLSPDSEHV